MIKKIKFYISLIVLPFILLTPSLLWADNPASIIFSVTQPVNIYVDGDGENYTQLSQESHPVAPIIHARAIVNAGDDRKLNWWKLGIQLFYDNLLFGSNVSNRTVTEELGQHEESYVHKPRRKRPSYVVRDLMLSLSHQSLNNFAVAACNQNAMQLRQGGSDNNQIFSNAHKLLLGVGFSQKSDTVYYQQVGTHYIGTDEVGDGAIYVVCRKHRPTLQAGNLQLNEGVPQATLNIIEKSTLSGSCKINLSAVIQTTLVNTQVQFRFEHDSGAKSDIKTVTTSHSKTAMEAYWYDVPNNPNGSETGNVRILGVSHNFQSAWKSYELNCRNKSAGSLVVVEKPVVKVGVRPVNFQIVNGMRCPLQVEVKTSITSKKSFTGNGVLAVRDGDYSFSAHEVNVQPYLVWKKSERLDLKPWANVGGGNNSFQFQPGSSSATGSQRFDLRYILSSSQTPVVQTPFKTVVVRCTKPVLLPGKGLIQSPKTSVAPEPKGLTVLPKTNLKKDSKPTTLKLKNDK